MNEEVRCVGIGLITIVILLFSVASFSLNSWPQNSPGICFKKNFSQVLTNLDSKNYDSVVSMSVKPKVKLRMNAVAMIASEGVMGREYVQL